MVLPMMVTAVSGIATGALLALFVLSAAAT